MQTINKHTLENIVDSTYQDKRLKATTKLERLHYLEVVARELLKNDDSLNYEERNNIQYTLCDIEGYRDRIENNTVLYW